MKYDFDISVKRSELIRYIYYVVIALLLTVLHVSLIDFISIGGITPDLIIILCVWVAISEGQFIGLFGGFLFGLILDIVTMDVIGTNALSKLFVAFAAGFFFKEGAARKIIGSYKFLLIVLGCSIFHNAIYQFFYLKASEASFIMFFMKYGIATALYTTIFAIFPMLSRIPRKGI